MKLKILSLIFVQSLFAAEWQNMFNIYRSNMDDRTYSILSNQYDAYKNNDAPTIADVRVKQIPIIESQQALVDLRLVAHPRIKVMEEHDLPKAHTYLEDIDPRSERHGWMRTEVFEALERMIEELDLLAPTFGYEVGELEIRLFEGLRDIATQKQLFDTKMAELLERNPGMTEQQAYQETCKWVSPYINNVPAHSTGGAIDIHLWSNKTNSFCDMGRFNVGGALAPTFCTDSSLSEQQQKNRFLFLIAATKAGLINYVYEFWHFSYGDRYASYWQEANPDARQAIYGSV